MSVQLQEFLEKRSNKLPRVSPAISAIHEKTDRVETDRVAKEKEFYTKRGKYISKGSLYHIHYTKDLEVHYMTGGEHNERTQLIFRNNIFDSDFDYYNTLNRQETIKLEPTSKPPTDDDLFNLGPDIIINGRALPPLRRLNHGEKLCLPFLE